MTDSEDKIRSFCLFCFSCRQVKLSKKLWAFASSSAALDSPQGGRVLGFSSCCKHTLGIFKTQVFFNFQDMNLVVVLPFSVSESNHFLFLFLSSERTSVCAKFYCQVSFSICFDTLCSTVAVFTL